MHTYQLGQHITSPTTITSTLRIGMVHTKLMILKRLIPELFMRGLVIVSVVCTAHMGQEVTSQITSSPEVTS